MDWTILHSAFVASFLINLFLLRLVSNRDATISGLKLTLREGAESAQLARNYFIGIIQDCARLSDYVEKSGHLLTIAKQRPKAVVRIPRVLDSMSRNAERGMEQTEWGEK